MTAPTAQDVKVLRERTDAPMMDCRNALIEAGNDMEKAIAILKEKGKTKAAKRADRETTQGLVAVKIGEGNQGGAAVMIACETDFAAKNEHFTTLLKTALDCAWKLPAGTTDVDALLAVTAPQGGTMRDVLTAAIATVAENMTIKKVARLGGVVNGYVHFDQRSCALVAADAGDAAKAATPAIGSLLRDVGMHVVAAVPPPLALDRSGVPPALVAAEKEIYVKRAAETGKPPAIIEKIVGGQVDKFIAERVLNEQAFVKNPDVTVGKLVEAGAKAAGTTLKITRFERFQIGV